mmetsp:Transcript_11085/g.16526  ORF Transcript_11085/g.16526 Transcript_11085/m.16526 type:complete len:220 (-) Transcript_11085:148-807(-)
MEQTPSALESVASKSPRMASMLPAVPPPIVFLDIDGVLLPFGDGVQEVPSGSLFPDRCLAALSYLLSASAASLVLSSTWRVHPQYIRDIVNDFHRYAALHGGPLAHIAGFPRTTCPATHSTRQEEIWHWLSSTDDPVGAWIALDDEPLTEGPSCRRLRSHFVGHVVQTSSHEGLTMEQAKLAVTLLESQGEHHSVSLGSTQRTGVGGRKRRFDASLHDS